MNTEAPKCWIVNDEGLSEVFVGEKSLINRLMKKNGYMFHLWEDAKRFIVKRQFEKYSKLAEREKEKNRKREKKHGKYGIRFRVFRRDNYKCRICGKSAKDGVKLELDHIHPASKGGEYTMENLQVLCRPCNIGKRDHLQYDKGERVTA